MSSFKPQQRRLLVEGRAFHFVAYEGHTENVARNQPAQPPMWCLMLPGGRCPVTPFVTTQSLEALDRALTRWLLANAF